MYDNYLLPYLNLEIYSESKKGYTNDVHLNSLPIECDNVFHSLNTDVDVKKKINLLWVFYSIFVFKENSSLMYCKNKFEIITVILHFKFPSNISLPTFIMNQTIREKKKP